MKIGISLTICIIAIIYTSNTALSQVFPRATLQSFFNEVLENPNTFHKIPSNVDQDKFQLLIDLESYQNDSISNIRKYSYLIANNLTAGDEDLLLKQKVVNFLLQGYFDKNSGICGIVSDLLKNYQKNAFNNNAHQKIRELLYASPSYYHELIKLAGYINIASTSEILHELLSSGTIKNNEPYWAAKLALARIGEQSAIEFCMNQIKSMEINDDLIYDFVPDLVYTHQREATDFLIELLHSTEKNCESSNAESTDMIVCGYRIMEYLAPNIIDFPLKISESGDIETDNYPESLQYCRDWFIQNPDYNINNEKY